jgi:integrase
LAGTRGETPDGVGRAAIGCVGTSEQDGPEQGREDRVTAAERPTPEAMAMSKISAPYLAIRVNSDGTARYYFQPRTKDVKGGWKTVRLHDLRELPINDPLVAADACRKIVTIYKAWRAREPGAGPHLIDDLGRVVALSQMQRARPAHRYMPGQIGAMVADYLAHEVFLELSDKTKREYSIYLDLFVEKFGDTYWTRLAPGAVRTWLRARAEATGASGAHSLYRTIRAFFGKVRLIYEDVDHPGFVPDDKNPVTSLNLSLPPTSIILWPREAIDAFVALADASGQPSIGDAIVMMGWLGVRRQDWLSWSADVFVPELLAFRQEKTERPLVLPWKMVPALVQRVTAAKVRRLADAVSATTFFHDRHGRPWASAGAFRKAFNELRDELAKDHPSFPTRYYVGLDPANPLSLPTAKLTMRTMRHTCITLNHDAGVPRELISAITGHELATIDAVMKCYTARTADQAAAALNIRLAHEAKRASS